MLPIENCGFVFKFSSFVYGACSLILYFFSPTLFFFCFFFQSFVLGCDTRELEGEDARMGMSVACSLACNKSAAAENDIAQAIYTRSRLPSSRDYNVAAVCASPALGASCCCWSERYVRYTYIYTRDQHESTVYASWTGRFAMKIKSQRPWLG